MNRKARRARAARERKQPGIALIQKIADVVVLAEEAIGQIARDETEEKYCTGALDTLELFEQLLGQGTGDVPRLMAKADSKTTEANSDDRGDRD